MHHTVVIAKIHRDNTGVITEIPVILTDDGPIRSLLDYMLHMSEVRSFTWMQKLVRAVRLLLDYMAAHHDRFDDPKQLFELFVTRLYTGTIGDDGLDPSGLYWLPLSGSREVSSLVSKLTAYSDWLAERIGAKQLNPWREATRHEEMLNWAAWHQKHNRALLAHTVRIANASKAAKTARSILLKRDQRVPSDRDGAKKFPDERLIDLLFDGFIVPGKQKSRRIEERLNMRNILMSILMAYGGLRVSEPFHLFVHDVLPDPFHPERALVRIFHPVEGLAPDDWMDSSGKPIKCNREAYLRGKYELRPRTKYFTTSQMHAGWKGNVLDSESSKFMHVHWFPTWAGELFLKLWDIYMVQRALKNCDHPFAFVTEEGRPYSIDSFEEAFAKAVKRIGLTPAKILGTTPHGLRHAYAQRVRHAKVSPRILMKAMHHASIESQLIYTRADIDEVTEALNAATDALNNGQKLQSPDLVRFGFEDVDPLGLFSGSAPKLGGS